jgi:hypothetical protein
MPASKRDVVETLLSSSECRRVLRHVTQPHNMHGPNGIDVADVTLLRVTTTVDRFYIVDRNTLAGEYEYQKLDVPESEAREAFARYIENQRAPTPRTRPPTMFPT